MFRESTSIIYLNTYLKTILFYLTWSDFLYVSLCIFMGHRLHLDSLTSKYSLVDKDCVFSILSFSHSSEFLTPKEPCDSVSQFNNNSQGICRLKRKWGCILNSVMSKHKTGEIALSWEIRDWSFSFTSNELCFVLLGKSTSLLVCDAQEPSLCSRLWLLFLSAYKPEVIAPVGNPFKVLRTPALETALPF